MLNSDGVLSIITSIGEIAGKNEKTAALSANIGDSQVKRAIEYALNPFKTFNIAKRFDMTPGVGVFDENTWGLLDDLIARNLTGNNAKEALAGELSRLTPSSQELLWRIIKKDLRAGFGDSTVNKTCKGLLPVFPYQRCSLPKHVKLADWDWANGIVSQEKADGMFANLNSETGVISMTTRQGSPFPMEKFSQIEAAAIQYIADQTQSHGEILVEVGGVVASRHVGNGIINRILDGGDWLPGERPIFKVWDQIPLSSVVSKGKCATQYRARLAGLLQQLLPAKNVLTDAQSKSPAISVIDTRIVFSMKEAYQHYVELLKLGKEGTIVKRKEGTWKDGTSKDQVKLKLDVNVELEVVGFVAGNGKNAALFGSLTCRSSDGLLQVNVSGFTDAKRLEIHNNREGWLGKIITVCSNAIMEVSPSNPLCSLFLPRYIDPTGKEPGAAFVEERRDKVVADTLQEIRDQFESAIHRLENME